MASVDGSRGVSPLRPRLRDSVLVFQRHERLLQFLCLMDLRVKEFDAPSFVADLVPLLDGSRTCDDLAVALDGSQEFSLAGLSDVLRVMRDERLLHRATDDSQSAGGRYERQGRLLEEFIASFDHLPASVQQLQRRLLDSHVVVVGAGGLGGLVLQSLAAAGVGRLEVFDPDVVEQTNLNRQVIYGPADLGAPKVEAAARRLEELNPDVMVIPRRERISRPADLDEAAVRADLLINCADEPNVGAVSDLVADAAHPVGTPHLVGGAYGANLGVAGTSVVPHRTTCWRCIRSVTRNDHARLDGVALKGRGRGSGTLAPITSLVGSIVAWEALRILLDLPLGLANQVRELDIFSLEWRVREISPRDGCPRCPDRALDHGRI